MILIGNLMVFLYHSYSEFEIGEIQFQNANFKRSFYPQPVEIFTCSSDYVAEST